MALIFRAATAADVPAIVALLADDPLAQGREGGGLAPYLAAFAEIGANPVYQLIVGEIDGALVATCQLTILAGLSHQGGKRALIEAVRTAAHLRSQGIGAALMAECEARARGAGATQIQLATDKSRLRAHGFYARAGFVASHLGFRKKLN